MIAEPSALMGHTNVYRILMEKSVEKWPVKG
jgi:hypothetical protein